MKAELINKYLKNPEIIIFQNINNHLKQRQLKQLFIICRQMKLQKPNLQFVFVTNKAQNLKQGCQTSYSCERNKLSQLIVPINNLQKKNYLPIYYPHLLMHNIFLLQYNKKKATLSWSSYFKNFPLLLKTQQKIIQAFYRPDKLQIIAKQQSAFNTICLKITKINTLFCFNKHIMQVFLNKNLFLYVYNETNVIYEEQKNW